MLGADGLGKLMLLEDLAWRGARFQNKQKSVGNENRQMTQFETVGRANPYIVLERIASEKSLWTTGGYKG